MTKGYDQIFSLQLAVLAREGDVLIVLSGSGNSPNILKALEEAKAIGMTSYAVLGFAGGKAKALADVPIHFRVDDMQIAEDAQMIVGHMLMQWLYGQREDVNALKHQAEDLTANMAANEKYLILGSNSFSGATFADHLAAARPRRDRNQPFGRAARRLVALQMAEASGQRSLQAHRSQPRPRRAEVAAGRRAPDPCGEFRRAEHGRRKLASSRTTG